MNARKKKQVIQYLTALADGAMPDNTREGVCSNVIAACGLDRNADYRPVMDALRAWPLRGKSQVFPIGGGHEYVRGKNLWTGKYGKRRRDLCRWIADQLSKQ